MVGEGILETWSAKGLNLQTGWQFTQNEMIG